MNALSSSFVPWLILGLAVVLIVVPGIVCLFVMPPIIFKAIAKRTRPDKWSREHPSSDNPGIVQMWGESLRFRDVFKDKEQEIEATTADGLRLKGLYYDFGSDTAVILLGGRPETCIYSLYYAYPYAESGINVCAIDPRAHGLSEGEYSGCGYAEAEDIFTFTKVLAAKGIKKVILHGICVGACAATFAASREDRPKEIAGLVTDGLFIHYYETLKMRIRKNKGPVYPTVWVFRSLIKKLYGFDCKEVGPIVWITKLDVPCLMIASKEDIFSLPANTQLLFDANSSKNKKLEWFEHGPHSHLRRVDPTHYDTEVRAFISKIIDL